MSRKLSIVLTTLGLCLLMVSAAFAEAIIDIKGYSTEDVARYDLMTQKAQALSVIAVGSPSYLKSWNEGTYTWSLAAPTGSAAVLSSTTDREVYFIPDMAGEYTVTLELVDGDGATTTDTQVINAGKYVGVADGNCKICHSGKYNDWAETGHASITKNDFDGVSSSFIRETCNNCHTTGYDLDSLAVNDGFDDRGVAESYSYPDSLFVGAYDAFVTSYPSTAKLANVQCEACHGPASEHPAEVGKLAVSLSGEVCKYCHDSPSHHPQATQWVTSVHGDPITPEDHFTSASCVGCHTAEGFFEQNVEKVAVTTPYDPPHGQTCVVCHNPHEVTGERQLRVASDMSYLDSESQPVYSTTGEASQACTICHHFRPGRDYPGQVPHRSHQTEMLDNTAGWMNPDKEMPSSNPHGTLIEKRCAGCHMASASGANANIVGSHTFAMKRAAGDTVNTVVLTEDVHNTEACVGCHSGIEDFDINGVQTQVSLMLNELFDRLPKQTSGRLAGYPINDSTSLKNSTITVDQLTAAFNWYIVDYDGSKGVHNPAMSVALLEDALDRVPAAAACLSLDINADGKLGIADAVTLILNGAADNTQACIDRNGDFKYDLLDVIKLLSDIWGGTMLAGEVEIVNFQMDLTADQIQYVQSVIDQLELTVEQAEAFQIALTGDGTGASSLPKAFALAQNAPNPFNPSTTIQFAVPEGKAGTVSLKVYDVRGRLVRSLVDATKDAGTYTVFWDGTNENGQKVSSGVYFYRMTAGDFTQTRKMVMLK